jgi:hypothetical protein
MMMGRITRHYWWILAQNVLVFSLVSLKLHAFIIKVIIKY